jgi:hypothetical protein
MATRPIREQTQLLFLDAILAVAELTVESSYNACASPAKLVTT